MLPSFFIFSLPRSGSSWLSVFLTGPDSYCYHEPTADYTPGEWLEVASRRKESVVGAIDTGAYLYPEKIPSTRYFTLRRNDFSENLPDHEPIYYSLLNDIGYLREVWEVLIGKGFDEERAKTLTEMNIQRDIRKFFGSRPNAESHMRRLRYD